MADLISSFGKGYRGAEQREFEQEQAEAKDKADRRKAKLSQYNKERTHNLAVGTQHNQNSKNALAAWDAFNETIDSGKMNPNRAVSLLREGRGYDQTFGDILKKGSAQAHIARRLNMGVGTLQRKGEQGPPGPGDIVSSPNAGFPNKLARLKYEAAQETEETKNAISQEIMPNLMARLKREATTPDGVFDPTRVSNVMLAEQVKIEQTGQYDRALVVQAFDEIYADIAEGMDRIRATKTDGDADRARIENTGRGLERFVKTIFAVKGNILDEGIIGEGDKVAFQMINDAAQRWALQGYSQPAIEVMLAERFVGEDGKWAKGPEASNNAVAIMKAGKRAPEFKQLIDEVMKQIDPTTLEPYIDPLDVKVVYDEETNAGGLQFVNGPNTGKFLRIYGEASLISDGPVAPGEGDAGQQPKSRAGEVVEEVLEGIDPGAVGDALKGVPGQLKKTFLDDPIAAYKASRERGRERTRKILGQGGEDELIAESRKIKDKK